jgi:hypothetical protein
LHGIGFEDEPRLWKVWPWEQPDWWKPSDNPIRNLEKAGALIAAEIDRLIRKGAKSSPEPQRVDNQSAKEKGGAL